MPINKNTAAVTLPSEDKPSGLGKYKTNKKEIIPNQNPIVFKSIDCILCIKEKINNIS